MDRKELLVLMAGASAVNYIGRTAMAVSGPDIARQFHFSEAELGHIFAAFWLGYTLVNWPSGWLADRFGAARVLGLCGLATAALLAGNAAVSFLTGFLILRFLFGAASAVLYPACASLALRSFLPDRLAGVQGLVLGGSSLGAALAPALVVWLSLRVGWRGSFAAIGAITAVFFVLWTLRVKEPPARSREKLTWLRPGRALILLAAQAFCVGYFYSFTDTWSFYYFREVRHFPEERSALFAALLQIGGGAMMPIGGWLSDQLAPRIGRLWPIFVSLCLGGLCLSASTWMRDPSAVLACIVAALSFVVACEGANSWAVLINASQNPASGYGFTNAISSAAQFIAPLAFPWIAGKWGWDWSLHSAAAALLVSSLLWRLALRGR